MGATFTRKVDLPPQLTTFLYDTIDAFDYDCNGELAFDEAVKLLEVLNIEMTGI